MLGAKLLRSKVSKFIDTLLMAKSFGVMCIYVIEVFLVNHLTIGLLWRILSTACFEFGMLHYMLGEC